MAGTGDSVDGVATCYRLDSQIWTPVGGKTFSLSPTCFYQPLGPNQPCLLWEMAHFPGSTAVRVWSWSPILI